MRTTGGKSHWHCDDCGAIGYLTIPNQEAAVLENIMTNTLEHLAKEGREPVPHSPELLLRMRRLWYVLALGLLASGCSGDEPVGRQFEHPLPRSRVAAQWISSDPLGGAPCSVPQHQVYGESHPRLHPLCPRDATFRLILAGPSLQHP